MADKEKNVIRIDSILGGHSQLSNFAASNQFRSSLGIDPTLGILDPYINGDNIFDPTINSAYSGIASGLLRPTPTVTLGTTTGYVKWLKTHPKDALLYAYDSVGSVYSADSGGITGLGDLNDGGTASGNGMEYYDNYIYFARDTTIARYGPLSGASVFTDNYWASSLGQTALTNTTYPITYQGIRLPNHVLHRHSDGRLYIADVVGNQGTIHYIQTSKTTVEGDTNNGSRYNAMHVGFGLWPVAIESYGSELAIAFIETGGNLKPVSKLAFWDTISQNVSKITWVEFPDAYITSMKNINGVLHVMSTPTTGSSAIPGGFRITRFVGGYTFEQVYQSGVNNGESPPQGAVDGTSNRLLLGSYTNSPEAAGSVYALDLQGPTGGMFNIMRCTASSTPSTTSVVTAVALGFSDSGSSMPTIAWKKGTTYGVDTAFSTDSVFSYGNAPSMWWSQIYGIGQPFKITKIRIPLAAPVAADMTIIPKIYTDDGAGTTYTLATINNTNYPNGEKNITYRLDSTTGQHNFWLELRWTGTKLLTVGLPITIEYEIIDD